MTAAGRSGRVAIVTGGTGLIGASIVRELAGAKASVCIGYLDSADAAASLVDEIAPSAPGCSARSIPVADEEQCGRSIDAIGKEYGRIDILVHAAGVSPGKPLRMVRTDDVSMPFSVNVFGAAYATRSVLPWMIRQRWGRVVFLGSRAAAGLAGASIYAASKAALLGLARSAAKEYGKYGVTVNVVSPARVEGSAPTRGPDRERLLADYPMGRFVSADEVATLVGFLTSDAAAAITGQEIVIDAGYDPSAARTR